MMKQKLTLVASIAFLAIITTGCGGGKKASIPVPKDAAVVMRINSASLGSKLSWNEIKSSEWFKLMTADAEEEMTPVQKSILENPENAGIDLNSDMYFFYEIKGKHGYVVAQGQLSDPKKFETTLSSLGERMKFKKDGDINSIGEDEACLTWDKSKFMFVGATPAPTADFGRRYDEDEEELSIDSLVKYAKGIYNLKQNASMSSDARFTSLLKEPGDMHILYNSSAFTKGAMGMLKMLKAGSLLEGNATGMALNFENGKISINSKSWYGKELGALMKKYQPSHFDAGMLKRIPSDNLAGFMAMNYPPEALKEFLKLLGVDGLVNGFTSQVGVSIDDFIKANKGDVLLAVSDFSVKERSISIPMGDGEPYVYKSTGPDANILFATSVKDKAAFGKLVDAVRNEIGKDEDAKLGMKEVKYAFNDNWFVLGNNQATVDGFAGGSNSSIAALASQVSGHPFGGFIDFQKIFPNIQLDGADGEEINAQMFSKAAEAWDNMIFYGGEMKDGATTGHFEINLKDKSTNSLKQLYTFFNNMANEKLRREMDFDMEPPVVDSTILPPPAIPVK
jgi:hypothetical protein